MIAVLIIENLVPDSKIFVNLCLDIVLRLYPLSQ